MRLFFQVKITKREAIEAYFIYFFVYTQHCSRSKCTSSHNDFKFAYIYTFCIYQKLATLPAYRMKLFSECVFLSFLRNTSAELNAALCNAHQKAQSNKNPSSCRGNGTYNTQHNRTETPPCSKRSSTEDEPLQVTHFLGVVYILKKLQKTKKVMYIAKL